MLNRLSKKIAQFFCERNIIPKNELEAYSYGYEIMLMSMINWGIILIIMFSTSLYLETITYISVIILMRHHTGGYHAETHLLCGIISIASYIIVILISVYFPRTITIHFMLLTMFISFCTIVKYAPVEHKNHSVSANMINKHRYCSIIFFCLISIVAIIFWCFDYNSIALSTSLALFQVGISILLGIHKNIRQKEV